MLVKEVRQASVSQKQQYSLSIEDVAFSSHTDGGKLKYSTPSISKLQGVPMEQLDYFESVTYQLSLIDYVPMT